MLGSVIVTVLIVSSVILFAVSAHFFAKNKFIENDNIFSQAGVTVDYSAKTITIKKSTFSVDDIKKLRWESGAGNYGNISYAYIEVNSFKSPIHRVDFITPNASERFISRLTMAIEKAGGPNFS